MPRKPPVVFPQEQRLLSELGERLRLARKRRKLSSAVVAQRAGISRTTVYKVEAGAPGATLGTYVRVLAVLGLKAISICWLPTTGSGANCRIWR